MNANRVKNPSSDGKGFGHRSVRGVAGPDAEALGAGTRVRRFGGVNLLTVLLVAGVVGRILRWSTPVYITALLVFLYLAIQFVRGCKLTEVRFSPFIGIAAVVALWVVFVTAISPYEIASRSSYYEVLFLFLNFAIGVLLAKTRSHEYIRVGAIQVSNLVVLLTIVGFVLQYALGLRFGTDTFGYKEGWQYAPFQLMPLSNPLSQRMSSVFSHPIVFADVILIALAALLFLEDRSPFNIVKFAVLVTGLLATRARGAWIGFALLLVFYLFREARRNDRFVSKSALALPVAAVLLALLGAVGVFDFVAERFLQLNIDASYTQRAGAISYIVGLLMSNPASAIVGYGNGASSVVIAAVTIVITDFKTVDNGWISAVFDYGAVVAAIMLVAVVVVVIRNWNSETDLDAMLAVGVVLMGALDMCFYNMLTWYVPATMFLVSLAWLLEKRYGETHGDVRARAIAGSRR